MIILLQKNVSRETSDAKKTWTNVSRETGIMIIFDKQSCRRRLYKELLHPIAFL